MKTPAAKWHIAVFAALSWLTMPVFNAAYYMWRQANHAYPINADSIAIPIYGETLVWAVTTPIYALIAWLVVRTYRGGRSFLAFDTAEPLRGILATLFWGGLAAVNLYGVIEAALLRNGIDMISYVPWIYLFFCLRSSAASEHDVTV